MTMTIAQVYRRAVEVLDERGWHQGWYVSPDGRRVCLLGACAVAAGGELRPSPTPENPSYIDFPDSSSDELWWDSRDFLDIEFGTSSEWNDRPERTVAEVKAALLRAAELASRHEAVNQS